MLQGQGAHLQDTNGASEDTTTSSNSVCTRVHLSGLARVALEVGEFRAGVGKEPLVNIRGVGRRGRIWEDIMEQDLHFVGTKEDYSKPVEIPERRCLGCGRRLQEGEYVICWKCDKDERDHDDMLYGRGY